MKPNWSRIPWLPPAYRPPLRRVRWGEWTKVIPGGFFDLAMPDEVVKFVPANDLDGYWW